MLILVESNNLLLGIVPESLGMFIFGAAMIIIAVGLRKVLGRDNEGFASEEPINILANESEKGRDTISASLRVNEK